MRHVRGRLLDVGVGSGRVALHLQESGHEVLGIDISPLAVEVARRRGVEDARVLAFKDVGPKLGMKASGCHPIHASRSRIWTIGLPRAPIPITGW